MVKKTSPKLTNELYFLPITNIKLFANETRGIISVRVKNRLCVPTIHPHRAMIGICMIIPVIIMSKEKNLNRDRFSPNTFLEDASSQKMLLPTSPGWLRIRMRMNAYKSFNRKNMAVWVVFIKRSRGIASDNRPQGRSDSEETSPPLLRQSTPIITRTRLLGLGGEVVAAEEHLPLFQTLFRIIKSKFPFAHHAITFAVVRIKTASEGKALTWSSHASSCCSRSRTAEMIIHSLEIAAEGEMVPGHRPRQRSCGIHRFVSFYFQNHQ